jgi:hypothetical protein
MYSDKICEANKHVLIFWCDRFLLELITTQEKLASMTGENPENHDSQMS